jgi:hypothetical protein
MLWRGATLRSRVFGRLKKHVVQRRAQKARLVCACASVPWFSVTSKGCCCARAALPSCTDTRAWVP